MKERYFDLESTDIERIGLAEVFSKHLRSYRSTNRYFTGTGEIALNPPDVVEGWVRIPHLVTVVKASEISEIVMWEKLSNQDSVQWLDANIPDQDFIEKHLAELLDLKKRSRENTLDPVLHKEIIGKLSGRYLSILFVYQHFQFFKDLWGNETDT